MPTEGFVVVVVGCGVVVVVVVECGAVVVVVAVVARGGMVVLDGAVGIAGLGGGWLVVLGGGVVAEPGGVVPNTARAKFIAKKQTLLIALLKRGDTITAGSRRNTKSVCGRARSFPRAT